MPSPFAMSSLGHVRNAIALSIVLFGMPSPFAMSSLLVQMGMYGMPSLLVVVYSSECPRSLRNAIVVIIVLFLVPSFCSNKG